MKKNKLFLLIIATFSLSSCIKGDPFIFAGDYINYAHDNIWMEYSYKYKSILDGQDINQTFSSLKEEYIPSKGLFSYYLYSKKENIDKTIIYNFNLEEKFFLLKESKESVTSYYYFDYLHPQVQLIKIEGEKLEKINLGSLDGLSDEELFAPKLFQYFDLTSLLLGTESDLFQNYYFLSEKSKEIKKQFSFKHSEKKNDLEIKRTYSDEIYSDEDCDFIKYDKYSQLYYVNHMVEHSLDVYKYEGEIIFKKEFTNLSYNDSIQKEIISLL